MSSAFKVHTDIRLKFPVGVFFGPDVLNHVSLRGVRFRHAGNRVKLLFDHHILLINSDLFITVFLLFAGEVVVTLGLAN